MLMIVVDLIIVCGRFEGYDERVVSVVDEFCLYRKLCFNWCEMPAIMVIIVFS